MTYKDDFVPLTECRKIIKRTWFAADKCGNTSTAVQTINYTEETPPVLVIPPDYKGIRGANCEYDKRPVITGQANPTDNCDTSVDISYTDNVVSGEGWQKTIAATLQPF